MQTKKMSLANMQGKLSRSEMKNIMAGSGSGSCTASCPSASLTCTSPTGSCGISYWRNSITCDNIEYCCGG